MYVCHLQAEVKQLANNSIALVAYVLYSSKIIPSRRKVCNNKLESALASQLVGS